MDSPYIPRTTEPVHRIHVGFTEDQMIRLRDAAFNEGISVSSLLRNLVDRTIK